LVEVLSVPDSTLARDNLFQLNVLIWASFPQPRGAPVTPVLRNAGYAFWSIEQPLNSNTVELARLRRTGSIILVQPNPVADAVFQHESTNTCVLVECKPSSFGVNSEWAPQARGLIVAGGNVTSRLAGVNRKTVGEVCYLIPEEDARSTDATLVALAREVSSMGFPSCPTGPLGVSIKDDGVYLGLPSQPQGEAKMPREMIPKQRIVSVHPGQDPSPLYVIPWIPDVQDNVNMEAFKEKLRQRILAWLGKSSVGGQISLLFEDLLNEISQGVLGYWRDKASKTGRILPMVAKVVSALFGDDVRVNIGVQEISVKLNIEKDRGELMERVRTAGLPQKLPEGVQLRMENQH
jgi:hypothetical protein